MTRIELERMSDLNRMITYLERKKEELFEKRMKELGYNGCKNCKHQIEPLRGCEWLEHGGDGVVHLICPKWEKRGEANGMEADRRSNDRSDWNEVVE